LVYAFADFITHSNSIALSILNLRRGSTILNAETTIYFGSSGSGIVTPASNGILDSPNTTSSVTYGTFIKTGNSANTASVSGRQNIIVMEVAG
jgi:hypothetical protein